MERRSPEAKRRRVENQSHPPPESFHSTTADWAQLPSKLLQLVAQRLPLSDCIRFAAVCQAWRSVATRDNYSLKTRPPWLMFASAVTTEFFPLTGSPKREGLKMDGGFSRSYASRGWIARGGICGGLFLSNPFFRTAINFPALKIGAFSRGIRLFAISPRPSESAGCSVLICFDDVYYPMWAWRSGQREWMLVEFTPASHITQVIHYKGQFVAVDAKFQILTLEDGEESFRVRMQVQVDEEVLLHRNQQHLVECSGSLLLVAKKYNAAVFRVFEVDLENRNWREVKSLGNTSLFLNGNSESFSVELDDGDAGMVKSNCIYFKESNFQLKQGFCTGIYHMENGHVERKFHEREWAWFQPCF